MVQSGVEAFYSIRLHPADEDYTLVLMASEDGDLRDRFRRTDYSSVPIKPRPVTPLKVDEIKVRPERPLPTVSKPDQPNNAVMVETLPKSPENGLTVASNELTAVNQEAVRPILETRPSERPQTALPTRQIFVETPPNEILAAPAISEPRRRAKKHLRKERRQRSGHGSKKWLIITPIVLLLLGGANFAAWKYLKQKSSNLLPAGYTSQALGFTIYYPKDLPDGFRVAPNSFTTQDGAMIFYIDTPDGKNLPVSEQTIPDGSTADQLVPAPPNIKVTQSEDIGIPGAKSSYAVMEERTITSTVIDKTWIIINSTSTSKENAIAVTKAFKKIDK